MSSTGPRLDVSKSPNGDLWTVEVIHAGSDEVDWRAVVAGEEAASRLVAAVALLLEAGANPADPEVAVWLRWA